jgi:hypothetical protein
MSSGKCTVGRKFNPFSRGWEFYDEVIEVYLLKFLVIEKNIIFV